MKKRKIGTKSAFDKKDPGSSGEDVSLIQLPLPIARQVREIGFVRVEQDGQEGIVFYHPIICLHPKSAPNHIRSVWMEMYNKVSNRKMKTYSSVKFLSMHTN